MVLHFTKQMLTLMHETQSTSFYDVHQKSVAL